VSTHCGAWSWLKNIEIRFDRRWYGHPLQRSWVRRNCWGFGSLSKIYKRWSLKWPQLLQVDPRRVFMGAVTKEMDRHKTNIRRGRTEIDRDQAIVERFNRTLAERLFGHQYAVEMRIPEGQRSSAWLKRLPEVVSALNNGVTRLIWKNLLKRSKKQRLLQNLLALFAPCRKNGQKKKLPAHVNACYLYQPGELECGRQRATDPSWSLQVFNVLPPLVNSS